jgi:hypothetical protein
MLNSILIIISMKCKYYLITLLTLCFIFATAAKIIATQNQSEIVIQHQKSKSQSNILNHNEVSVTVIKSGLPLSYIAAVNNLPVIKYLNILNHNQISVSTSKSGFDLNTLNVIVTINNCINSNYYHKPLKSKDE